MHPYTIFVRNHSGRSQDYYLFADTPDLLNKPADDKTKDWRIVFQASLLLPSPHGSIVFPIKPSTVAICGTAKEKILPGVVIYPSDWQEVVVATDDSKGDHSAVTMPMGGDAAFDRAKFRKDSIEQKGAFAIAVDNSFRYPHPMSPFVGLGAPDPHKPDNVVPLAIYGAEPSTTYCVLPNLRFCVVAGTAEAGQIVDITDLTKSDIIDLSTGSTISREVIHKNDGTFTVDEA
ncbi:hypothetical protein MMC11_003607 [Xylographa trunciseda]|nr:hypothetical protein [Xylographa trunciseda]